MQFERLKHPLPPKGGSKSPGESLKSPSGGFRGVGKGVGLKTKSVNPNKCGLTLKSARIICHKK